jgi:hypothetical protein
MASDPTCYTIFHQVIKVDDFGVVFSATYAFSYSQECQTRGNSAVVSGINGGDIETAVR